MAYNQNNSQKNNDEVYFDLMENIGVLANKENGWTKEVNIVAWNGGKPKVDIRDWDPRHERMTRGITLFEEEAEKLAKALARRYGLRYTGTAPSKTFRRVEHTEENRHYEEHARADSSESGEEIPFESASDAKAVPEEASDTSVVSAASQTATAAASAVPA